MKIPEGTRKQDRQRRLEFYLTLIERCRVSRVMRRQQYSSRRLYWLYGSDGSYENEDTDNGLGPPPGNKIWPHIDQLTSFLYAQDTTRFSIELATHAPRFYQRWVPQITGALHDEWHNSDTDLTFGAGLALALVYGSTFLKPAWKKNGISPGLVLPHNFGVLREDVAGLAKQEAFCHWFTITPSQFRDDYAEHPRFAQIFASVNKRDEGLAEANESGLERIIMSSQDPLGVGGQPGSGVATVDWLASVSMNYVPRVREDLIELTELYLWDDAIHDYRIVTLGDPNVLIFDRPLKSTGWLAHEPPAVQIVPNPDPGYFWGVSEVERLVPLQTQRNRCMAQIEHLQDLQAHPPSTASGFPGDLLELQYVLDTPNGMLNQPDPAGIAGGPRAERVKIDIAPDLYARLERIDEDFQTMSGLPPVTQGHNPPGVRAGGHAAELAKLGSSRARKRALIIEDALEALATLYVKLKMKYDPTIYATEPTEGQPTTEKFILEQFTQAFTAKVDAHSNSPIFVDDQTALAFELLKAGAITRRRLIEMVPVYQRQQLLDDLEHVIEPAEKAAAQRRLQLEEERIRAHMPGRPEKSNGGTRPARA